METSKLMDGLLYSTAITWVFLYILMGCWFAYDEHLRPWLEKKEV